MILECRALGLAGGEGVQKFTAFLTLGVLWVFSFMLHRVCTTFEAT